MSLQSERGSQRNTTLDKLVKANAESVEKISLTPYEMTIYAIPKEQRDAEFRMLQEASRFQPELYRRMSTLATAESLEEHSAELEAQTQRYLKDMTQEMRSWLSQAGRMQEKFISDSVSSQERCTWELRSEINRLRKMNLWFLIGTTSTSLLLAVLASALLQGLLG